MSALKDQLQSDLTDAIRAQDELTMATLRMALAAITNAEVSGKEARQLSDDEVVVVLTSEATQSCRRWRDGVMCRSERWSTRMSGWPGSSTGMAARRRRYDDASQRA